MSDMEETEGPEVPVAPHRVIGPPPPSPRLLGSAAVAEQHEGAVISSEENFDEHLARLGPDGARVGVHGQRAEKVVAACFTLAFIAGCGFIAAYVGLGVHTVDKTLRSNLALGFSLSVTLAALGLGALIWVRHLMPDVEMTDERHDLRPDEKERKPFQGYFMDGQAD